LSTFGLPLLGLESKQCFEIKSSNKNSCTTSGASGSLAGTGVIVWSKSVIFNAYSLATIPSKKLSGAATRFAVAFLTACLKIPLAVDFATLVTSVIFW
jgi:hypothetical protein